jgi:hypothetical protein
MRLAVSALSILFSVQSMAADFKIEAENFTYIFQNPLQRFRLRSTKLVNKNLFRENGQSITFEFPTGQTPPDCGSPLQTLDFEVKTSTNSLDETFTFTDCNGRKETLKINRTGADLKAISLRNFLNGDWALPTNVGTWILETSWNPLKINIQKTKEIQTVFVFLGFKGPDSIEFHLEYLLKETNSPKGSSDSLKREYGAKWGYDGRFSHLTIQNVQEGSGFPSEFHFLEDQEINPPEFSQMYTQMISGGLVPLLGMTLENLPMK